ncbi:MAG TPA: XdhC family protein, partial [Hyphomonadaceae bacterium]
MSDRMLPPGLNGDIDVLAFAEAELAAGRPAALVTIVGLDGPFSRPLGAQLAVAGDRRFAGSISGGCLEQALTEEAQLAMKEGTNRTLRYGRGSPYIDVRLPCGGGIDLYVDVDLNHALLQRAVALGRKRKTFSFLFDPATKRSTLRIEESEVSPKPGEFVRRFEPKLRLLLAGRGWEIVAMSQLARTADAEIVVASQEPATLEFCKPYADELIRLTTPQAAPKLP